MNLRRLFAFSLCLNVVLAAAALWLHRRDAAPVAAPVSGEVASVVAARPSLAGVASTVASEPGAVVTVSAPFQWSQLEAEDYTVYMRNLRAFGCPESTLRKMVIVDVNEQLHTRIKGLVDEVSQKFWPLLVNEEQFGAMVNTKEAELKTLAEEREKTLAQLLGTDRWEEEMSKPRVEAEAEWRLRRVERDLLSAEQAAQVAVLRAIFRQRRAVLAGVVAQLPAPERAAKLKAFNDEEAHALSGVVPPAEAKEIQMLADQADAVLSRAAGLPLDRAGLRELVRIETEFNVGEPLPPPKDTNYAAVKARVEIAKSGRAAALENLLGADGKQIFERAADNRFQNLAVFTARLSLPEGLEVRAFNALVAADAVAKQLRADKALPDVERRVRTAAIRAETERELEIIFGPEAFGVLKDAHSWMLEQPGAGD